MKRFNKLGQTGEAIIMMYRVLMVSIVAVTVFFMVSLYYDFYADTLDREAIVLNRAIVNC